jgi:Zn ribbon nucleic-acid-binding protein
MPTAMNEVIFTCSQCQATDTVRLFAHEATPSAINCHKCKAGAGKSIEESLRSGVGMFPPQQDVAERSAKRLSHN